MRTEPINAPADVGPIDTAERPQIGCPLCEWSIDAPNAYSPSNVAAAPGIAAALGLPDGASLLGIHQHQEARRAETELDNHLRTHGPHDWLPALMEARTERDILRAVQS